jgi:hypothetical protein
MRWLVAALAALVLAASAAGAKQVYTLSLVGVSGGMAEFSISRSVVGEDNLRNLPFPWLQIRCDDGFGRDEAIQWGTWDSPTGIAELPVSGNSCEAYVSLKPWLEKVNSNVVEFAS